MTPFTDTPTLVGDLVELRPFTAADAPAMAAVLADPEVLRLTGSAHTTAATHEPTPLTTLVDWYGSRAAQDPGRSAGPRDRRPWDRGRRRRGRAQRMGRRQRLCELPHVGGTGRSGSRAWHRGHAPGARPRLHRGRPARVELEVYDVNPRAWRVYDKVGLCHEGTRRDALRFDDQWIDAHVMGLLAAEWPGLSRS